MEVCFISSWKNGFLFSGITGRANQACFEGFVRWRCLVVLNFRSSLRVFNWIGLFIFPYRLSVKQVKARITSRILRARSRIFMKLPRFFAIFVGNWWSEWSLSISPNFSTIFLQKDQGNSSWLVCYLALVYITPAWDTTPRVILEDWRHSSLISSHSFFLVWCNWCLGCIRHIWRILLIG